MKPQILPSGNYRARVTIKDKRISKTFKTAEEAVSWAQLMKDTGGRANELSLINVSKRHLGSVQLLNDEISEIDQMSGSAFEDYCASLIRYSGYLQFSTIQKTRATGDYGADLIITTLYGEKICVQCKRIAEKGHVGTDAIQEVVASKKMYGAKRCVIMTNSSLTPNAIALAQSNKVLVIDRDKLKGLIKIKNEKNGA